MLRDDNSSQLVAVALAPSNWYPLVMQAIRKKIVFDEKGKPQEVIISWTQFCELSEALGLDLDPKSKSDLRATRRDLLKRNSAAFKPLSAL
jgi:hypothetical protein